MISLTAQVRLWKTDLGEHSANMSPEEKKKSSPGRAAFLSLGPDEVQMVWMFRRSLLFI